MKNAQTIGILIGTLSIGGALGYGVGTKQALKNQNAAQPSSAPATCYAGGDAHSDALFELDGKVFTDTDLPDDVESSLYDIRHESHEKVEGAVKETALRLALAKEKGHPGGGGQLPLLNSLLPQEKPTEEKIKAFYEANKGKIPPGTKYEDVKPQIEQYLAQMGTGETMRTKSAELEKAGRLKILVKEPVAPVVNIDVTGFPSSGPSDAKVTVVEASDYLCPHCQKMQPEVEAVVKDFKDEIRFVQINFALRPEGLSGQLARGAFCAQKQGNEQFWKYHEHAFKTPPQQQPGKEKEEVLAVAKAVSLNLAEFEKCLASNEAAASVESAAAKMHAIGVAGTPTFFVNNKKLSHHTPLRVAVEDALFGKAP